MPKPPPQDVSGHPRAVALLHWTRRALGNLAIAWIASFFLLFANICLRRDYAEFLIPVFAILFFAFLAALLVFAMLHGMVVLIFFVRVSLRQIVASVLLFNLLLALMVRLPNAFKWAPGFALFVMLFYIGLGLLRQDPSGEGERPGFVKRALADRLRERINRRREQQRMQQGPVEGSSDAKND